MMNAGVVRSLPWILVLTCLGAFTCSAARSSGGVVKLKTDNKRSGYYYNALGSEAARYVAKYDVGDLDPNAIICGTRTAELEQVDDFSYVLGYDLRLEDPNAPEYADLSDLGLIANADPNSITTCNTFGGFETITFGGGSGIPDPSTRFFITLAQPANNDPSVGLDFCGITLNTVSVFVNSARSQSYRPGGVRRSIGFNHFVEAIVFEPKPIDLHLRMTGSSRFPGDRGLPVMFARRDCLPSQPDCFVAPRDTTTNNRTDDLVTARIVIDNNRHFPDVVRLALEADRSAINPKLEPIDVLDRFRPSGGGAPVTNPMTLPVGRTLLTLELRTALPRRFLAMLPLDLRFRARAEDPDGPPCEYPADSTCVFDVEGQYLGLRPNAGYYDSDDHSGGFFFTQSPVLTGDALAVRFETVDLPKPGNTLVVSGVDVVAGEFGTSGLAGLDAVELRREDAVLARNPDLSPQGLYRARGTVGDPGNADGVPTGLPVTTVLVDFTDYVTTPAVPGLAENLFAMAYLSPGDTGASVTAIGSAGGGDVFIGNSSTLLARTLPVQPFTRDDLEIRLDVNGALSTAAGAGRRTKRLDPLPELRIPGVLHVVEKGGRIVE